MIIINFLFPFKLTNNLDRKAINLKFAGVDVIIDRDTREMYVLEIQSFPGYERGFDLMKFLADYI